MYQVYVSVPANAPFAESITSSDAQTVSVVIAIPFLLISGMRLSSKLICIALLANSAH